MNIINEDSFIESGKNVPLRIRFENLQKSSKGQDQLDSYCGPMDRWPHTENPSSEPDVRTPRISPVGCKHGPDRPFEMGAGIVPRSKNRNLPAADLPMPQTTLLPSLLNPTSTRTLSLGDRELLLSPSEGLPDFAHT